MRLFRTAKPHAANVGSASARLGKSTRGSGAKSTSGGKTREGSGAGHGNSPDQAFGTSPSSGETSNGYPPRAPTARGTSYTLQVPDSSRRRPVTRGPSCSILHANTLASPPAETINRIVRSPRHEYHICRASSYGKRRLTPPHSSCAASSTAAQGDHAEQVVHFIFIIFLG